MSTDVFIYDLKELDYHSSYIWDVLSSPSFDDVENIADIEYEVEGRLTVRMHESGSELYIDEREHEIRIYDPGEVVREEFSGLLSASTGQQILEE